MNEQDWTVEAEAYSSGIRVQIVSCDWPRPSEYFETSNWHALNFSLTAIPAAIEGFLKIGSTLAAEHGDVGRLVFVPAHSQIGCRGSGGRHQRAVRAFLDPACLAVDLPTAEGFMSESLRGCLDIKAPEIAKAMVRLCRETLEPDFGSGLLLESLGGLITVELERLLLPRQIRQPFAPRGNLLSRADLKRVVEYVDSQSSVNVTITEVAKACNISSRSLTRKFKQTTGETLHEYAHKRATKRARALLRDMSRSIKEVSYDLGFLNPSAFSIAFRRATGLSPSQYRRSVA
jgi:AraC family transcriptional regulator